MTQTVDNIRIRGDIRNGYLSEGPVIVLNGAGNPMDPQPAPHTMTVTQTGLEVAYLTQDARVYVRGSDAMAPDAPFSVSVSAVETGTADDLTLNGAYDPDQVGEVGAGVLGNFTEAASIPDPAAPPAPPADPA